jgi:hypothetical protein
MISFTPLLLYTPGKNPLTPTGYEAERASLPMMENKETSAPARNQTRYLVHNQSLFICDGFQFLGAFAILRSAS